jgi:adenosylhomocysteine nucleosidase
MTPLIMTPLPEEFDFFIQAIQARGVHAIEGNLGPVRTADLWELGAIIAIGGHGKTQFAVQTRYLLDQVADVSLVLCVGAAGALAPELEVGDVVLGTDTVEHVYRLRFVSRPDPRFPGDPDVIASLTGCGTELPYKVVAATLASGDEDIIDTNRAIELAVHTGAMAVAWEGAGAARACRLTGVPHVEVRGITDSADHDAPGSFEQHLAAAMSNVAHLIVRWAKGMSPSA